MPPVTPIKTDGSNTFAHHTVCTRLPKMVDQIIEDLPGLPAEASASLRQLQHELETDARLRMFAPPAPDYDAWVRILADHDDRLGCAATWKNAEWFVLEHFFFRRILAAVDYWNTGVDPFGPAKARELAAPALGVQVETVLQSAAPDAFNARLAFALWGNRMDLSHTGSVSHAVSAEDEPYLDSLIINESEAVLRVAQTVCAPVHFVCDNAGTELAADLCLADWFMQERGAGVHLHVKDHPTFVSDATADDVHALVDRLGSPRSSQACRELARRLTAAIGNGQLVVTPDHFWNRPSYFSQLPARIISDFAEAALIVIKGDMNYRRLLGDRVVPATDPLQKWAPALPAPAVLLRTMKGDPLAGVARARLTALDREDPGWRTAGKHGVIQLLRCGSD
jgi:damage control phosphatase ARMT1-like protein